MNKAELVAAIAEKANFTKKDAEAALNAVTATRERKARQGRNPRQPEEVIQIEASKAPVFKAGKALKDAVNK